MTSNENNAPDINLDEFLPMPGAADILTGTEAESEKSNTVFSKPSPFNTEFLEKKEEKKEGDTEKSEEKPVDLEAMKEVIDDLVGIEDDTKGTPGRPKIDKSGLVDTFSKLIDEGLLVPFDDDKPMDEYSMKDWKELLEANFEDRENKVREQVPQSFFEALPEELKYAYMYIAEGGQDLKGLFKHLSHVEEVRQLDPKRDSDQEQIVKQYLRASRYGTDEQIQDQINEYKDNGTLEKRANQFKPMLDQMQKEIVEYQLQQQEQLRKQQEQVQMQFYSNVYNTLKDKNLNGIKLNGKMQDFLYTELTEPKYTMQNGGRTNLLGHLLERYQYQEPRYDLVAEALWLLADPEGYKDQIMMLGKNQATQETVRKLKTEESRKISTSVHDEDEPQQPAKRKLPRQQNIFKR
jgi:hypothetical protein